MAEVSSKPNILWVFGDQHRAQALGCSGDPNLHTPNIDRFAAEGVNFTAAVGGCPLCCPYRGSLLSGRYPHHAVPGHEYRMPPQMPTIAQPFRQAGYHTAYFGKWHVDGFHERDGRAAHHIIPIERRGGFDTWIGYENNNSPWDSWVHGHEDPHTPVDLHRLAGYETDCLTDMLIDYVKDAQRRRAEGHNQPFFAVLSVQPPHDPFIAPEAWMARHTPAQVQLRANVPDIGRIVDEARRGLAGYYAMIENLDWNFGRIRAALAQTGLADSTHIVFFSDHGEMLGSHGQFRKTSPWEESIRVPFIIGGGTPFYGVRSGRVDAPINHVDVGPTSLGLAGIDKPQWMAGADYSGYCITGRSTSDVPDSAYLQLVVPTGHGDSTDRPWRGIVTRDRWKYVVLEHQPWLLFDLNEDPYEQVNLAHNARYHAQRHKLTDRLRAWMTDTGDDFAIPL